VLSLGKLYGGDVQTSSRTFGIALGGTGAHSIGRSWNIRRPGT
jgi:hypothetical protein